MCLAVASTAWAESINEKQAQNIATRFMASHAKGSSSLKLASRAKQMNATAGNDKASYYIFNAGSNNGYVIVAGDDRAPAVLGYSDKGSFNNQDVPQAMQELLESYAAQIEALGQGAKAAPQLKMGRAITPLVKATWSQNNPFNVLLPILPDGKHAAVGCVATALAQVMYYWQWPARPTRPVAAYTSEYTSDDGTLRFDMPELPVIDFNWSAMQGSYLYSDSTSAAGLAAATLNLYCAQAMEMNFKFNSSGATTSAIPCQAATYFDYDATAHMESRSGYTAQGWADLLYNELAAGRPVIYSGRKMSGGHAFICDGYDGNGMFHFNWGWNGNSNGYFLLNVLNPDLQGTGSASGTYGYILGQGAIVGFQPNKNGNHYFEVTATDVSISSYTNTRSYTNSGFRVTASAQFHNYTSDTLDISYGWGLFDNDMLVSNLYSYDKRALRPGYHMTLNNTDLSFGYNITSGTYRIMPMYSEYNQGNWRPCAGAENNYIEVTIDGNKCTIIGHGTAGTHGYVINDINVSGTLHNGRTANINLNMTNNGTSSNSVLYMFANGTLVSAGYLSLETGETGDVPFMFMPSNAGNYTLTWSWNSNGSNPIYSYDLAITQMPTADLSATIKVLNVTDTEHRIITGSAFSFELTITNNGSTTYDEDISAKLYKNIYGSTGSAVQGKNQRLVLEPGETTTIRFDMDNVINNWKYFVNTQYYSAGKAVTLVKSTSHTIALVEPQAVNPGDVNMDGNVNINDVTALINYLLNNIEGISLENADVKSDGNVNISDVTELINWLLNGHE